MIALVAVVFALVASAALADTSDLEWSEIEVNGHGVDYESGERIAVEEGETLEVSIELEALADVDDIQVEIELAGYEYDDYEDLEDESHTFSMEADTTKFIDLELELPKLLDEDEYYLYVRVSDRNTGTVTQIIELYVEPSRHGIEIEDVVLSPGSSVEAGHSLLATVELQNFGSQDEEDIKVTIAVEELGIEASDYIDVLEADLNDDGEAQGTSKETTEELFLSIPDCAEEGVYSLDVTVEYDEYESTTTSYSLTVTEGDYCTDSDEDSERLVIAVGPESQEVNAGSEATYAIALSNEGSSSESYTLSASVGSSVLSTSFSESLVVLESAESSVVYLYVSADAEASEGDYPVTILVENDGVTIETISLTLEVDADESASEEGVSLRNGLEIALIVLVVLLVIVGLIIGFSRLRGSEDEEQTYY